MKLSDHAFNTFSQFGEDGIIEKIFEIIGEGNRRCVEFGAGDGLNCSNTKRLREQGWTSLLIEADEERYRLLGQNVFGANVMRATLSPRTISGVLQKATEQPIDFMCIDVDGDDYAIWLAMQGIRVRVICIEYNGSIPPHISLRQVKEGDCFGASALALVELSKAKGFELVAVTQGNLLFVCNEEIRMFNDYERSLDELFPYEHLTYVASNYQGQPLYVGPGLPWGMQHPYVGELVGADTIIATSSFDKIREALEAQYGQAELLDADWPFNLSDTSTTGLAAPEIKRIMEAHPPLIIVNVSQVGAGSATWLRGMGLAFGYRCLEGSGIVALIRETK